MKVATIVGARPQFIKMAPVSRILRKEVEEIVIHTGQHYDYHMSQLFFEQLNIPRPDYNLGIGSGPHGEQTGKMMIAIEDTLLKERPDFVLIYGDTNSTLAGALAAAKMHIPIGHVEAGLRSFDKTIPEEINRVLSDHISTLLFAPTVTAVENLAREGITNGVYRTGDVMYDSLMYNIEIAKNSTILENLELEPKNYFLATIHRPSNTDNPRNLKAILEAFCESGEQIVFPMHPRTKRFISEYGLAENICDNIMVIPPVGYIDFLYLEKNAKKILTDSGGIQKEAYILKVPCITLRKRTEWIETVEDGWNILVGADKNKILDAIKNFMPNGKQRNAYGNGKAAVNVVNSVLEYLNK